MAKVIAIANQKGGVGKTTTCVNLSSCVAALGKKVLVVDLDPQGNTTSGYGVAKKGQQSNIYTCLINDDDIRQAIVHTKFNADLIASNTQLAGAVVELVELPRRENRLRSILAPLIPLYDYVFIDCPPSLDLLTVNGLCACDTVLIPIQCEYYALEGLSELMNTLKIVRKKYNHYLDIEGVVFTMYSGRFNLTYRWLHRSKSTMATRFTKPLCRAPCAFRKRPVLVCPSIFTSRTARAAKPIWPWRVNFWKITSGNDPGFPVWEREVCEWQNANWAALAKGWTACLKTCP